MNALPYKEGRGAPVAELSDLIHLYGRRRILSALLLALVRRQRQPKDPKGPGLEVLGAHLQRDIGLEPAAPSVRRGR